MTTDTCPGGVPCPMRQTMPEAPIDLEARARDRRRITDVITDLATSGRPFSANTVRERLPDVRPGLIGARFTTAHRRGLIDRVGGDEPSPGRGRVDVWIGTGADPGDAPIPGAMARPTPAAAAVLRILEHELGPVLTDHGRRRRWRLAHHIVATVEHELTHTSDVLADVGLDHHRGGVTPGVAQG